MNNIIPNQSSRPLIILRKILRIIYQFFYVIMFVDIAFGLFQQPMPGVKLFSVLFACLVLSYVFRDICRRGVILLITHVLIGVGSYFLIDNVYVRLLSFAVIFAYFIDGLIYIRNHYILKRFFESPWPCMIFGVITIALGYHIGDVALQRVGYIIPVLIIFSYLVSLYVEGLEEYLNGARRVSGAPMKQIVSTNSLIVLGILTVFVVTILLGNVLHFDTVLKDVLISSLVIVRILVVLIMFILKLVFSLMFGDIVSVSAPQMRLDDGAGENALGNILDMLFIIAIIAVSVAFVILFFRWLIRMLLSRQKRIEDVTEELHVKRKVKAEKEKYTKEDKLKGSTPDMVARRLYKTKVLSFKKYFTPERNSTTLDIQELMITRPSLNKKKNFWKEPGGRSSGLSEEEIAQNVSKLTDMYDEVRYGEKMPDSNFIRRMKKLKF
ncbi:hypothetical protein SAMN02910369_02176 [Lachnospiraceae bacterium NE2001]|nr:hypothetical protein SAMN02910369_02176 [Lachnospiraceae bacterium NE2001]